MTYKNKLFILHSSLNNPLMKMTTLIDKEIQGLLFDRLWKTFERRFNRSFQNIIRNRLL